MDDYSHGAVMKLAIAAIVVGFTALTQAHAASCYVLYDRNDQVLYRDLSTPIDLSQAIGPQVNAKWPGGALVIVEDVAKCISLDVRANRPIAAENANVAVESATKTTSSAKPARKRARAKATGA
jgi:hypothetical protein